MLRVIIIFFTFIFLIGCLSYKYNYYPPSPPPERKASVSILVDQNKDNLCKMIEGKILELPSAKPVLILSDVEYLTLEKFDKDTGFFIVTYEGDPEEYVNCGRIEGYFENLAGKRSFDFPASRKNQAYERGGGARFEIRTRMDLRITTRVEIKEHSENQSLVTVSSDYKLIKNMSTQKTGSIRGPGSRREEINFRTGEQGVFQKSDGICQSKGTIEEKILLFFRR